MKTSFVVTTLLTLSGVVGCMSARERLQIDLGKYNAAASRQDWSERLTVARKMVRDDVEPLNVRLLALSALADYAAGFGSTPELDEEAQRYYREGHQHASNLKERTLVDWMLVLYYSKSKRNGEALPYMKRALKAYETLGDEYSVLKATFAISSAHNDMGEIALRDIYRRKALEQAEVYFGKGTASPTQWLAFSKMHNTALGDFAERGEVDRILEAWKIFGPKFDDGTLTFASLKMMNIMEALALAGAVDRAEAWVPRTEAALERDVKKAPSIAVRLRADFACHVAMVYKAGDRLREAAEQYERCFELRKSEGLKSGLGESKNAGVVYERLGDYEKAERRYRRAIEIAETLRSGYSIAERARFFRTLLRESYSGIVRIAVRRFNQTKDPRHFREAVTTAELVRGRQLGDLVADRANAEPWSSPEGSAVISTLATKEALVVLAYDRKTYIAQLFDGVDDLDARARRVALALSSPSTSKRRVYEDMQALGRLVLGPATALLESHDEVVALPDGVLNLVPFDLLIRPATRAPLLETHAVRILPILRLLGSASRPAELAQAALLGVGDPTYAEGPAVAGLTAAEIRSGARGSAYLSYFQRLPETRSEIESIAQMVAEAKVTTLFGPNARESVVKSMNLKSFYILHLATHGILGGEVPGVSEPALVLADERDEDGFLTASEIEQLELDSRLTVLSACNTGSGELIQGEGVMGLSRSFLLAGSDAVVVSLWPVDSKSTEALMVEFYRQLREGQQPAEALRNAKLRTRYSKTDRAAAERRQRGLRKTRRTRRVDISGEHPFYWAPFILVGH